MTLYTEHWNPWCIYIFLKLTVKILRNVICMFKIQGNHFLCGVEVSGVTVHSMKEGLAQAHFENLIQ